MSVPIALRSHSLLEPVTKGLTPCSLRKASNALRKASFSTASVTCGRRPGKDFLTLLQHWSGAVTCPAC